MSRKIIVASLVVILAIAGIVFYFSSKQSSASEPKKTYKVGRTTLQKDTTLSGEVSAEKQVALRFQTSGKLAWVGVKEGDVVKAGQAVASLDQRELQKRLERSLKDFSTSRLDLDQQKDTHSGDATGSWNQYTSSRITRIVEEAQLGVDRSVIDVELATLNKELAYLITPIEGVVTRIDQPFAGVNITPAQAEIEITDPSTLRLTASADQQDVVSIREGMTATIVFDAFPSTYKGRVTYVAYTPRKGEEHVYNVHISVPKEVQARVRPGMSADITLLLEEKSNILSVPIEALVQEGESTYVYALERGKKTKRTVKTGIETVDMIEIVEGLSVNDEVLLSP